MSQSNIHKDQENCALSRALLLYYFILVSMINLDKLIPNQMAMNIYHWTRHIKNFKKTWKNMSKQLVLDILIIETSLHQEQRRNYQRWLLKICWKTIFPTIVVPEGRNDDDGHAITVVDDLIFDSTQKHALKLYRESLEWTCGFYGIKDIYFAVRFQQNLSAPPLECEIIYHWKNIFVVLWYNCFSMI